MSVDVDGDSEKRRLYLRAGIKLMVAVGFAFLLVPFVSSLPWPRQTLPAGSVLLPASGLVPGTARRVDFPQRPVWVTRVDDALRARLRALAPELWTAAAPELLAPPYFVVSGLTADGRPVSFHPAAGAWPGGFTDADGNAWDLAGRALKPGPHRFTDQALPVQNLAPMPFQRHGDDVLLVPPPEPADTPTGPLP
jgi:hypothetical protein